MFNGNMFESRRRLMRWAGKDATGAVLLLLYAMRIESLNIIRSSQQLCVAKLWAKYNRLDVYTRRFLIAPAMVVSTAILPFQTSLPNGNTRQRFTLIFIFGNGYLLYSIRRKHNVGWLSSLCWWTVIIVDRMILLSF